MVGEIFAAFAFGAFFLWGLVTLVDEFDRLREEDELAAAREDQRGEGLQQRRAAAREVRTSHIAHDDTDL